ncbi:MAG: acyltransferase [Pelagimonas sp.]|jgi:peptidoglycan/LPS O-acetylase OafA/YrhL|nr:acyltransferase [Pelagimonas sp.]
MAGKADQTQHLFTLDGLRGLAALVVVVSHAANAGFLPKTLGMGFGQMGVSLFYALSGLLMGRLYLHKPFTSATVKDYGLRRAARVLPLYYFALALGVVLLSGGVSPYLLDTSGDILRAAFLVHGTGVLWSIPAEIQFYFVFVGLWWAAARGRLMLACAILLGIQVIAVAALLVLYRSWPDTYNLLFWFHFFVFGLWLGKVSRSAVLVRIRQTRSGLLSALSWGMILCAVLAPPGVRVMLGVPITKPFIDPISAGYPLALLVAGLIGVGPFRVFAAAPLRWLGKVSFSIYLMHMPVLVAVTAMSDSLPAVPGLGFALILLGTLILSALTERLVEGPGKHVLMARGAPRPAS